MASVQTIDNASTPWPTIDSSMLINLRDAFDNPTGHTESNYPKPGQVLIHELPHAWPIENLSFLSRCICNGAARGRKHCDDGAPYLETGTTSDPPGRRSALSSRPPWSTVGSEERDPAQEEHRRTRMTHLDTYLITYSWASCANRERKTSQAGDAEKRKSESVSGGKMSETLWQNPFLHRGACRSPMGQGQARFTAGPFGT